MRAHLRPDGARRRCEVWGVLRTSSAPPPRTCSDVSDAATARAELIADRGDAAQRRVLPLPPVPRRRGGHPHAPNRAGGRTPRPLLVRAIPDGPERDAISPYAYPGIVPAGTSDRAPWRDPTQ